jgi:protein TonB
MIITSLGFIPPKPRVNQDKAPVLDIVLVSAKSKEAPKKADALAQANLDRGGNTDDDRRAKSPLPPTRNPRAEAPVKPAARMQKTVSETAQQAVPHRPQPVVIHEKQVQEVLTQAHSPQTVEQAPTQKTSAPEPELGQATEAPQSIDAADMVARSLEAARLEAIISKSFDDYQKRPKRKFLGGRTSEYRFASYIEAWRQKVERVGNLNYPEAAKINKLYGQLKLTVAILADGSVEKIELNRSSGHKVLDDAARRIVQLAAPYAPFPDDIRKDTDIIEITRTWTFTREDTLASGD